MIVRLIKKLADVVNGLDISHCNEGDAIELPSHHARMMIAEGWAEEVSANVTPTCQPVWRHNDRAVAADRPTRRGAIPKSDDDELMRGLRRSLKTLPHGFSNDSGASA